MIRIYGLLTPNVLKTVLAAEELSIHYEHVNVDLAKGEQKSPEFLKRNPFGMVPALEHEGRYLWESGAIVRYLGNFAETALYPADKWQRAQVDQWIDYANNHAGRYISAVFFNRCVAGPVFKLPVNETRVAESLKALQQEMPVIDRHLSVNSYLTGEQYTLADTVLFAMASPYRMASIDMSAYPGFERWFEAVKARPAVQAVIPKLPIPYIS